MADVDEPVNQLKLVRKVANAIENPVSSVLDATEWAFTINDRAVAALAAEWEKEPDSEIPTEDDLRNAQRDLGAAWERTTNRRKREMLYHAFVGRLRPEFYKDGSEAHLWSIVEQMEYPDMVLLSKVVGVVRKQMTKNGRSARFYADDVRVQFGVNQTFVLLESDDFGYLSRLERLGLVRVEIGQNAALVTPLGSAFRLSEFAWEQWPPAENSEQPNSDT